MWLGDCLFVLMIADREEQMKKLRKKQRHPRFAATASAIILLASVLACPAQAQETIIDSHIHLHRGEQSLREYETQVAADGLNPAMLGIMWFGGPNQALQGDVERTRANNDQLIALAATKPKLM